MYIYTISFIFIYIFIYIFPSQLRNFNCKTLTYSLCILRLQKIQVSNFTLGSMASLCLMKDLVQCQHSLNSHSLHSFHLSIQSNNYSTNIYAMQGIIMPNASGDAKIVQGTNREAQIYVKITTDNINAIKYEELISCKQNRKRSIHLRGSNTWGGSWSTGKILNTWKFSWTILNISFR